MSLLSFALNPYFGKTLFSFFAVFLHRLFLLFTGQLGFGELAADEIQILVLLLLAISSSLVGTFLVLKKMTMVANSLSHTILLGIVITYLIFQPVALLEGKAFFLSLKMVIVASLLTALLTTLCTEGLSRGLRLQEDASIGLVFTTFFSLGIVLVTVFTRSSHIGLEAIMGNVDALHFDDLKLVFSLFILNLILVIIFFKRLEISSFDPTLARSFGVSTILFNLLLMLQTAATAISGFRAVGVFLFLALLVAPVLTARFFASSLKTLILLSALIGSVGSIFAVALSRHLLTLYNLPLSTAGIVITTLAFFFLVSLLIFQWKRRV